MVEERLRGAVVRTFDPDATAATRAREWLEAALKFRPDEEASPPVETQLRWQHWCQISQAAVVDGGSLAEVVERWLGLPEFCDWAGGGFKLDDSGGPVTR